MTRPYLALFATTFLAACWLGCRSNGESQNANTSHAAPGQPPPAASTGQPMNMPMQPQGSPSAMGGMCPMQVPQTKVAAADVPGGAALEFSTTPDGVAEVRKRVAAMAQMHNGMHQDGGASAHQQMHGDGGAGVMMEAHAAAQDTPQGAQLVLHARRPEDINALRAEVRDHATHMAPGNCPMMGMGMGAMHHMH